MAKFRHKATVVDAMQWRPDGRFGQFRHGDYYNYRLGYDEHGAEYTVTQHGFVNLIPGDWIITGSKGEKYPCAAEIFAETYEPVD